MHEWVSGAALFTLWFFVCGRGAMRIFFINLDSAPKRREFMERQLGALNGVTVERVRAVTSEEAERSCTMPRYPDGSPLGPREVGCTLSHRALWKKMVDENIQHAIILEDDVLLTSRFQHIVDALKAHPKAIDFLRLETFRKPYRKGKTLTKIDGRKVCKIEEMEWGSAAYFLTRDRCLFLLEESEPMNQTVDVFTNAVYACERSYAIWPAAAIQHGNLRKKSRGELDIEDSEIRLDRAHREPAEKVPLKKSRLPLPRKLLREVNRLSKKVGNYYVDNFSSRPIHRFK